MENIESKFNTILYAILLIVLPIAFLPVTRDGFDPMRGGRAIIFTSLALIIIFAGRAMRISMPLALFSLYLIVWESIRLFYNPSFGIFFPMILGIGLILCIAGLTEANKRTLAWVYLTACLIQVPLAILQKLGFWWVFRPIDPAVPQIAGWAGGPALLSHFLAPSIPLALFYCWPIAVPILLAMLLTGSVGGLLASVVGSLWATWRVPKVRLPAGILGALALIFLLVRHGLHISYRWEIWKYTFRDLYSGFGILETLKTALFGAGPGGFSSRNYVLHAEGAAPLPWTEMHNEILQVVFDFGLVGLILLAFFMLDVFARPVFNDYREHRAWKGALLVLLISSLSYFPFQTTVTGLAAILIVGANLTKER
jgi:hypothetical protein